MARQTDRQKATVERVMHEFKEGELESGSGEKVTDRRQAIAIGLSEAGASNEVSPAENRHNRQHTKRRERAGATAQQRDGPTKAALYAEAKRRDLPGRSRMRKEDLRKALGK